MGEMSHFVIFQQVVCTQAQMANSGLILGLFWMASFTSSLFAPFIFFPLFALDGD
jgi:hypothetical protein